MTGSHQRPDGTFQTNLADYQGIEIVTSNIQNVSVPTTRSRWWGGSEQFKLNTTFSLSSSHADRASKLNTTKNTLDSLIRATSVEMKRRRGKAHGVVGKNEL